MCCMCFDDCVLFPPVLLAIATNLSLSLSVCLSLSLFMYMKWGLVYIPYVPSQPHFIPPPSPLISGA